MVLTMVEDIRVAGGRAAKIVSNMLQFSRRSESALVSSEITELIDQTIEIAANDYDLKKKYDFRQIKIVKDYASDLPMIKLVVTEFEQVILNLLKNSAQAMAEADMAGREPAITIRVSEGGGSVRVAVQDNGPGMDENVRKRVFEPFFTTKPVGKGTGLGLSVSYMIITNTHKGSMEVESVVGEGAIFSISLPLA
jgi:signal transduction histidine kinase